MVSINVPIPDDLRAAAQQAADSQGQTLEEFVRACVAERLRLRSSDAFLNDTALFSGTTPPDLSSRHDDYLDENGS